MIKSTISIESIQNHRIKSLVKLRKSSERRTQKKTLIEGCREVERALEGDHPIDSFYICNKLLNPKTATLISTYANQHAISIYNCTESVFKKITYRETSDGIIAQAPLIQRKLTDINLPKNPLVLIVEGVEKPGNIGTLIRTADASGVDAVIVINSKTDLSNPNVIRASMGSLFLLPVIECTIDECFNWLEKNNIQSIGLTPEAKRIYIKTDYTIPTALMVGSEDQGITAKCKKRLTEKVFIPMKGYNDSLNVSSAAAVVLYESIRQRDIIT